MQRTRNKNAAPPDLSCRVLRSGDTEVVLLSFTPTPRGKLTAAERDVALAVARGSTNAQIARDRQASPRTIANQVAAIMRKLGVSSRAELAARFGARFRVKRKTGGGSAPLKEDLIVDLLAALYRTDGTFEAWRREIMKHLLRLNPGAETCTWFEYDWHFNESGGLIFDSMHSAHVIGHHAAVDTWLSARQKISPQFLARLFGRTGAGTSMVHASPDNDLVRLNAAWKELWREPVADSVGIVAADPAGHGVCASIGLPERRGLSERQLRLLDRVAVHLSAGRRLREKKQSRLLDDAEAILSSNGKVLHALKAAKNKRESLHAARARRDEASKLKHDPEKALEIWKGLVGGRWSLVDHFDTDGKRLLLAVKNAPQIDPRADLSPRERRVCALVAMGHRDKEIAYSLGLSLGSVTAALHRARMKLKVSSRTELAAAWRKNK